MKEKFIIEVGSHEASEYIQKLAFKAGYKWHIHKDTVSYTSNPFLGFDTHIFTRENEFEVGGVAGYKKYKFPEQAAEIVKLFEKKEPEFKVGEWWWSMYTLFRVTKIEGKCIFGDNTFTKSGNRYPEENRVCYASELVRPATPEEIKAHLIKEAERRGFKEGAKVGCLIFGVYVLGGELYQCINGETSYRSDVDRLVMSAKHSNDGVAIYEKGQWAEIITEPEIKVNGYEAEFDHGIVRFGCSKFRLDQITQLNTTIASFNSSSKRKITNISLEVDGDTLSVSVDQIKLIAERGSK